MTDPIIIPSDERQDYHHNLDHNESNISHLLASTRKCHNLWQTLAGLKMVHWKDWDEQTKKEVTSILDNNKPY